MLMFKDGVIRTVEELDVQKFKENGWAEIQVKEEQPKQDDLEVVSKKIVRKKR